MCEQHPHPLSYSTSRPTVLMKSTGPTGLCAVKAFILYVMCEHINMYSNKTFQIYIQLIYIAYNIILVGISIATQINFWFFDVVELKYAFRVEEASCRKISSRIPSAALYAVIIRPSSVCTFLCRTSSPHVISRVRRQSISHLVKMQFTAS